MKSFQTLYNLAGSMAQNTKTETLTLLKQQINDAHRYLLQKYFNNENSFSISTVANQQFYDLPPMYSKMKTVTITVGNLKWTPTEVLTRADWDKLNVFPYYADIPNNYFIYNGQVGIWPIPATTGNTITMNYKIRVPDLSLDDYTTGTVAATYNSAAIVGTATSWLTPFLPVAGVTTNLNLWLRITQPKGDGNWYQIKSIQDGTHLTLMQPYQGLACTGASFTIGQMPVLQEDFHDLLTFRPLELYFATIQPDPNKHAQFKTLYQEGITQLDDYLGTKSVNVNLGESPQMNNPNLFWQA